jgi:hypothetical protein
MPQIQGGQRGRLTAFPVVFPAKTDSVKRGAKSRIPCVKAVTDG